MILRIGTHIYLLKTGSSLWGPVRGYPADVSSDSNTIRFYHRRDLDNILEDPEELGKLFAAAKKSRTKIPYAKTNQDREWVLETDEFRIAVSETPRNLKPSKVFNQDLLRGQGLSDPTREGLT